MYTDAEILEEVLRLGRACLEMEKADKERDPDVGPKTDEVIRLRLGLWPLSAERGSEPCVF